MNYFTISNGDTEDFTRFEWPMWDKTGQQIKAILDLTLEKSSRNWDARRRCWFIHNSVAERFIAGIRVVVASSSFNWSIRDQRTVFEKFEDFFETPAPAGKAPKTKNELINDFVNLLENHSIPIIGMVAAMDINQVKKLYRQAALALHPDRNNGDGSKMAELNIIWQELQTKF